MLGGSLVRLVIMSLCVLFIGIIICLLIVCKIICLLIVCTIILDVILTPVSMVEPALCDCPVGDGGSRNSRYKGCGKENFAS